MRLRCFLLFFNLSYYWTFGQANVIIKNRNFIFTEFQNEMQISRGWTRFDSSRIKFNDQIDENVVNSHDYRFENNLPLSIKAKHLDFHNLDFDEDYYFMISSTRFPCQLSFIRCNNLKLVFKDCEFDSTVRFNDSNYGFIQFINCKFNFGIKFSRCNSQGGEIKFSNCEFFIDRNKIIRDLYNRRGRDKDTSDYTLQIDNTLTPTELTLEKTTFRQFCRGYRYLESIRLSGSKFSSIIIDKCNFINSVLDMERASIDNQLKINETSFSGPILISGLVVNRSNTIVEWDSISRHKIHVRIDKQKIANCDSPDFYNSNFCYANLTSCYANLYYSFREQGNRFYANQVCYEWKFADEKYLKHQYDKFRDLNSWRMYYQARFLRKFSDYGTDPIKSISCCFIVIIFFSIIYFILPFDRSEFSLIFDNARFILHFYKSRLSFGEYLVFYLDVKKINSRKEIDIAPEGVFIPNFLVFLSKAHISRLNFSFWKIILPIIPKFKLFNIKVSQMSQREKQLFNGILAIIAFLNFVWMIIYRIVYSFFLSINSFSTLGYGSFSSYGVSKYLTVIEGFIGWVLLSIFSVVLLSQLIQ